MSLIARFFVLLCAAFAYWCLYWPSDWWRGHVLEAFGNPKYAGVWILIPHIFLYSTLAALVAAVLWVLLARARFLPAMSLRFDFDVALWGIAGGAASLALVVAYFEVFYPPGTLHWIDPNPWSIAGNVFSNFYEEFLFRGFLLVALTAVLGFWPAAAITAVAFGATHTQYPLDLRAMISVVGFMWALVTRQAGSIWAPYITHMVLDVVGDSLIG
jgi:membrane protease YdiL (CAAX protease family)